MKLSVEQQRLVEDHLALVRAVIRDKVRGVSNIGLYTYDDVYQVGCIGLCKAAYADKYQYAYNRHNTHSEGGARFSTYAYRVIWNEICTMLGVATKVRAELVTDPNDIPSGAPQTLVDDELANTEFQVALGSAFDKAARSATGVTAKGIQALTYMIQGYTSTEIAAMMGAPSGNNVTAWVSKARRYLKNDLELMGLLSTA